MENNNVKSSWFSRHKVLTVIIGIVLVMFIAGAAGGDTSTKTSNNETAQPVEVKQAEAPNTPTDHKSALTKAKQYSDTMHLSKKGIYEQLTSEYGEKFSAEAAQYAVDNLQADYNANALAKAKNYQDNMSMSPQAIREQLISEFGEKFTEAEADFAIANL